MSFVVACFYTVNTPYQEEVKRLMASVKKWNLPSEIKGAPSLGSWEKNCQYKAQYILELLESTDQNVVWVDADAEFNRYPQLFHELDVDLAFHYLEYRRELLSGTLFLGNNPTTKNLVKDWIALNATNIAWDQINLQHLVEKHPTLRTQILPAEYCYIYQHRKQHVEQPVITHYQASRRFKRVVGRATRPR